jgi:hypothetical protein
MGENGGRGNNVPKLTDRWLSGFERGSGVGNISTELLPRPLSSAPFYISSHPTYIYNIDANKNLKTHIFDKTHIKPTIGNVLVVSKNQQSLIKCGHHVGVTKC